ncbi:putative subtilisin-like protease precursor [Neoconidiobolus thromboides FSU 785]|nr:putative subtilisin-like protease precursor [Neoconidiobolus thromboides FSU 785]
MPFNSIVIYYLLITKPLVSYTYYRQLTIKEQIYYINKRSYLITLKGDTRLPIEAHIQQVQELFTDRTGSNKIETVFKHVKNTYHARLTDSVLEKVRNLPEVAFVEADAQVKLSTTQNGATWGISRISQTNFNNKSTYSYNGDGSGVTVYLIDTGILTTHPEFGGRARFGARFAGTNNNDENGHGTHCAGTIGSKTYGVSKNVSLVAVKVFDGSGSGSTSGIISAINWAVNDKKGVKGNVISMSLGGSQSDTLNNAVESAHSNGFVVVVAAGNETQDACNVSPASAASAITVAASDINDNFASFSNYGQCVSVIAPGVNILSTWNNGGTNTISGTSMATPHVAGLAAYLLSKQSLTNDQVAQKIIDLATQNAINNVGTDTPNLLAFNGYGSI